VPVMYAIFVLDFKLLKWDSAEKEPATPLPSGEELHNPSYS
jgi:hypothetical protein